MRMTRVEIDVLWGSGVEADYLTDIVGYSVDRSFHPIC